MTLSAAMLWIGIGLAGANAWASPLLEENFDVAGPLAGSQPAVGSVWQAAGGSGTLLKSAGTLTLAPSVLQEVESLFTPVSAGVIFAGITVRVTTAPTTPWILPFTFRGANVSGGDQVGRIFISTGTTPGFYRVGIENNMDHPVWWATELSAGTDYRLVLGFEEDGAADVTRLWVNPAAETDASIAEIPEAITGAIFGVRLNAYIGSTGAMRIDDLVVTRSFAEAVTVRAALPSPSPAPAASKIARLQRQIDALKIRLAKVKRIDDPAARKRALQKIRIKIRALRKQLAKELEG